MLLFGHLGITLALASGLDKIIASGKGKGFSRLVDYRLVLIGSMLPDIIDKPLGIAFPAALGSGRTVAHTFLFLFLLFCAGAVLYCEFFSRTHFPWKS